MDKKQSLSRRNPPKYFVLDVDGVMTTGSFLYSKVGKVMKVFGPDDNDALSLLDKYLRIAFISADKRGFAITRKRIVDDMKRELFDVSQTHRLAWFKDNFDLSRTVFMGDGIFDHYVFDHVGYAICPSDGFYITRQKADFVTSSPGGHRAVAEACLHILDRFFDPYDPATPLQTKIQKRKQQ